MACAVFSTALLPGKIVHGILKSINKSDLYKSYVPDSDSVLFKASGLPSFSILFKQIAALKYFWCMDYRTLDVKPIPLGHIHHYMMSRVCTHYEMAAIPHYVPAISNEFPDEKFSSTTRKHLRAAIQH